MKFRTGKTIYDKNSRNTVTLRWRFGKGHDGTLWGEESMTGHKQRLRLCGGCMCKKPLSCTLKLCALYALYYTFLRQYLVMQLRLTSNSKSSCLSLLCSKYLLPVYGLPIVFNKLNFQISVVKFNSLLYILVFSFFLGIKLRTLYL